MSYDLYVFDLEDEANLDRIHALLDDDTDGDEIGLTPKLADLVAELTTKYPGLDDDPDGSPWASWPLDQPLAGGRGCAFNMSFSGATSVVPDLIELAHNRGLVVYDPQGDELLQISGSPPRRRWWRRSGR